MSMKSYLTKILILSIALKFNNSIDPLYYMKPVVSVVILVLKMDS